MRYLDLNQLARGCLGVPWWDDAVLVGTNDFATVQASGELEVNLVGGNYLQLIPS